MTYSFIWPKYIINFKIKTVTITKPLPKLVHQGSDRYSKITLTDNITLLLISYREDQDIVILRVTEKEIHKEEQSKRRTYRPIIK